jgi:prolyl oligopeptidase
MPKVYRALTAAAAGALLVAATGDNHGPAWLDETYGERAIAWVAEQRERTLEVLREDPRFHVLHAEAVEILTDPSRIADVMFIDDAAYQYWQDRDHPLGLWRRTPTTAYLAGKPDWEVVLDLDALSARENVRWIFAGAACRERRCLLRLSENGKDAVELREFDLDTGTFVADGFHLPNSKSRAWWYDEDTLLVAPVLGSASLNVSLLPKTLRVWRRGTPLEQTQPIFTIGDRDAMLNASLIRAANSDRFVAVRSIDFERREYHLMDLEGKTTPLGLPELAEIFGVFRGMLLIRPEVDWTPAGSDQVFPAGALVGVPLEALMRDGRVADPRLIYLPAGDDALRGVTTGDDRLFVELLHDYYSRIEEVSQDSGGNWTRRMLPLPDRRFLTSMGLHDGRLLLREEAPLVPDRIVLADPATGVNETLYTREPEFDAAELVTELYRTTSRDGTVIDYTIIHRRDMPLDGTNPTLVYGYGGYEVPLTPRYEPLFGKLWMERGGVYVHAYLRGGGEHGPDWHRTAMLEGHVRPFEDLEAVLRDLHRRGVTSPRHTGIMGRSNGGLLVAAVMEREPELMNAVVVGGPLIDMLNFHELPPGGTWLAEYGNPEGPEMAAFLRSYSPMQNIAGPDTDYPFPLIITSTDDDRVLPGHARRFAYQLRAAGHENLYFEDQQGGHYWELAGGPSPGDWRLRAIARTVEFTYFWGQLDGATDSDAE